MKALTPAVRTAIMRQQSLLYLTLILGKEIFAWEGLDIRDLLDCSALRRLPDMPAFICGGVEWMGEAVPVVDLEARAGIHGRPISGATRIAILEMEQAGNRQLLGVVVHPRVPAQRRVPEHRTTGSASGLSCASRQLEARPAPVRREMREALPA